MLYTRCTRGVLVVHPHTITTHCRKQGRKSMVKLGGCNFREYEMIKYITLAGSRAVLGA